MTVDSRDLTVWRAGRAAAARGRAREWEEGAGLLLVRPGGRLASLANLVAGLHGELNSKARATVAPTCSVRGPSGRWCSGPPTPLARTAT